MKWYKLVFKQIQPIHIGVGAYGVISETRIFIPGWTMWGALTKAYNLENNKPLSENQSLFENISCFYQAFDKKGEDKNTLFPNFKDGEFHLGKYSEKEFRAKFVDAYISTAIVPGSRMAKDKSLHEINVILPQLKRDYMNYTEKNESQIYWVGIIRLENEYTLDFLKKDIEIFIGGDSRYGLGLMRLENKKEINSEEFKKWNLDFSKQSEPLVNYHVIEKSEKFEGKIELVASLDFSRAIPKLNKSNYCIVPGGKMTGTPKNEHLKKGIINTNENSVT